MATLMPMVQHVLVVAAALMLLRAGATHLHDSAGLSSALEQQRLWPRWVRAPIVRLLPLIELGVAGATLVAGAGWALRVPTGLALVALGSAFALVLGMLLVRSPGASCGCVARSEPVGPTSLLRPAVVVGAGLALLADGGAGLSGSLPDQVVVLLAGTSTAILVDLVVATAVIPRPSFQP